MPKRITSSNEKRSKVSTKRKFKKPPPEEDGDNMKKQFSINMKTKSPYTFFSLSIQHQVMKELGDSASTNDIANRIVEMWNNLSAEERCSWETKSSTDKSRYKTEKANHETPKHVAVAPRKNKKEKVTINKVITGPPKPPMDAFMHYCQEIEPIVREKYPEMSSSDVAIVTGEMWKNISTKDREYFLSLEAKEKDSYEGKLRDWKLLNDDFKQVSTETGGNQCIKIDVSEIKTKSNKKENDEANGEERSQNSDDSSLDGSTSNDDDLRAKIGKLRSRTPPFVMSNPPTQAIDKNNIFGLSSGYTSSGGGAVNYIANAAGGISAPVDSSYLPLWSATQALPYPTIAATAGVPGYVLVNPSNMSQQNQMHLQHPGLSSFIPTTAAPRAAAALPLQQQLLVQLPLNVRRQYQNQFPAYLIDGSGQL